MKVSERAQTITQNTTLMPEGYGGWYAKNIGTGDVEVNGFVLGEGEHLDFLSIAPNCVWNTPITIVLKNAEGRLRITRLQYIEEGAL